MDERVRIIDVSPRDGLQNEPARVPTAGKARLVRALFASGVDEVEVTSFVSPKWVPQLGDAEELLSLLAGTKPRGVSVSVLVPNEVGLDRALRAPAGLIDRIAVFASASETFSRRNTNASIDESLARFEPVVARARAAGLATRGYVSCAFACPFEGPTPIDRLIGLCARLGALGVDELSVADTIGAATPDSTRTLVRSLAGSLGQEFVGTSSRFNLHLHDTFGRAAACVGAALDEGVRSFDAAAGGLGGCPFASTARTRAPGNIDARALVRVVRGAGFECGVDEPALERAGELARDLASGHPGDGGAT